MQQAELKVRLKNEIRTNTYSSADQSLPVIGPAADLYGDQLQVVPGPRSMDPGVLATSGATLPDTGHEPLYLRHPDATELTRPKSVLHYQGAAR